VVFAKAKKPGQLGQVKTVVAGERDRPDVARRRAQWVKHQNKIEPERLTLSAKAKWEAMHRQESENVIVVIVGNSIRLASGVELGDALG
jgi:hypothetical protein